MEPPASSIAEIRRQLLGWRRSLSVEVVSARSVAAGAIASTKVSSVLGHPPTRVWSYAALHGELDPDEVTTRWRPRPSVALPVVVGGRLEFRADATILGTGAFGVREPLDGTPVDPAWAEVVLVPVVAFTSDGARVGHGKGFYDRALAEVARFAGGPLLVGLAHDEQEVPGLTPEAWDVPMDAIATPTRWLPARHGGPVGVGQPVAD